MADQTIYEPIAELHPRKTWIRGTVAWPRVSSVTVAGWPNPIAATPEEAIGKRLKVSENGVDGVFRIDRVERDTLILSREKWTDEASR